eukprot:scaffold6021_cov117-Isochrysis_galbana.AAC.15
MPMKLPSDQSTVERESAHAPTERRTPTQSHTSTKPHAPSHKPPTTNHRPSYRLPSCRDVYRPTEHRPVYALLRSREHQARHQRESSQPSRRT